MAELSGGGVDCVALPSGGEGAEEKLDDSADAAMRLDGSLTVLTAVDVSNEWLVLGGAGVTGTSSSLLRLSPVALSRAVALRNAPSGFTLVLVMASGQFLQLDEMETRRGLWHCEDGCKKALS